MEYGQKPYLNFLALIMLQSLKTTMPLVQMSPAHLAHQVPCRHKLWYVPVRDGEIVSIPSKLPEDVGVPDGISISVFHNVMRNPNCSECGVNFGYREYCMVIKDPVTDGQHKEALYYHMPKCCGWIAFSRQCVYLRI